MVENPDKQEEENPEVAEMLRKAEELKKQAEALKIAKAKEKEAREKAKRGLPELFDELQGLRKDLSSLAVMSHTEFSALHEKLEAHIRTQEKIWELTGKNASQPVQPPTHADVGGNFSQQPQGLREKIKWKIARQPKGNANPMDYNAGVE
jgi:chromosome segregation ATPase